MNILVCISSTPETTAKISFTDNSTAFNSDGVNYIMNPYDEWYALVRAIEIKEANGGQVTVVHVGPASGDIIIRKALAIGADSAIRVDADAISADYVAHQIAHVAKEGEYDIIFTGKETIDYNGSQVGGLISAHLNVPLISYASKMEVEGNTATVTRDVESGTETVKLETPFVVSSAKGMAEQRIPNMRGIMMAKRKPLNVQPAVEYDAKVSFVSYELPQAKDGVKLVDPENMDELVRLLHEEAKVI